MPPEGRPHRGGQVGALCQPRVKAASPWPGSRRRLRGPTLMAFLGRPHLLRSGRGPREAAGREEGQRGSGRPSHQQAPQGLVGPGQGMGKGGRLVGRECPSQACLHPGCPPNPWALFLFLVLQAVSGGGPRVCGHIWGWRAPSTRGPEAPAGFPRPTACVPPTARAEVVSRRQTRWPQH